MVGYYGQYTVLMDDKGRIALPAKLRPEVKDKKSSETFMLTKGLDGCLALYPQKQWELIQKRLDTLDFTSRNFRFFSRLLYSVAVPVKLDRQGRMLIPQHLQKEAGLDREILIIGSNRWLELWKPETYEQYLKQYGQSYEEVAEKLFDIDHRQEG
nr:division/cell wall cluster transcriptional repressor MraZ [candidate division Zixibacteria bacterium]